MSKHDQNSTPRLGGVELARGIAAYGVILIHVGMVCAGHLSPATQSLQYFCGLTCVPFFLAASFYFAAQARPDNRGFASWLKNRAWRLLVPYALWTMIYTGLQLIQACLHPDHSEEIARILADPMGRLFFGASGVALYFLPLLFVGLVIMKILEPIFLRRSLPVLLVGFVSALALSLAVDWTGNQFNLDSDLAFRPLLHQWLGVSLGNFLVTLPPLRFLLVVLAFALRCLPYIFLGWIFSRLSPQFQISRSSRITTLTFAFLFIVCSSYVPESVIGYAILLIALLLPQPSAPQWILLVGRYSFAVYLSHQVFLEAIKLAGKHHLQYLGLTSAVLITTVVYVSAMGLAWIADNFGGKGPVAGKIDALKAAGFGIANTPAEMADALIKRMK